MALRRREQQKNRSRKTIFGISCILSSFFSFHIYSSFVLFFLVPFLRLQLDGVKFANYFSKVLLLFMCFHCTYSHVVMYICALSKVNVKIFLMKLYAKR